MTTSYAFRAELWHYPEQAGWHFITLPPELAEELKDQSAPFRKSFGSVKVSACIAGQRWQTSLFPDKRSNSYLLPVKKAIRTAANLRAGDQVDVEVGLDFEAESDISPRSTT
ncbi:DUF1905 domain-containing protein [Arthrobacter sp. 131MFCol6.1]|uniref:DUF1905 domain-containing protein n=1 Tax=Arthrobacter sp. 131MFCol6.1 TaxID=1157944 RepID=UPI00036A20E2|nr:DUF1905 domain-containing protein [Arthrobacter sp. 131MFCol6.1]